MNDALLSISVVAIITAVFKILLPDERDEKQIRLLISCFFIISVINIFKNVDNMASIGDLLNNETNYVDYDVVYKTQTADEVANSLRKRLLSELEKNKIYPEKIYIDINISENNSISISKIRLVFTEDNISEAERAVAITEKCTGYEITVEAEEW